MAATFSSVLNSLLNAASAAVAGNTPLQYSMGGVSVNNSALIQGMKDLRALEKDQPTLYLDSIDNDITLAGDDDTEYFDE